MPVVCCQVAERLLDVGGDDPNDRRPTLRWLDIYATDNSHVHAPHRAWVQQVAHEMISIREINAKKANRRGSTNLKEEARGVAITAWLEEQAEKAKLMIAAEGAVVEAELLAKAEAEAAKAEWEANTTEVAGSSPTRVSYSLKRRSRAGWHDDKEAVLEVKAAYLKAEAEATVQGKAALAAAAYQLTRFSPSGTGECWLGGCLCTRGRWAAWCAWGHLACLRGVALPAVSWESTGRR